MTSDGAAVEFTEYTIRVRHFEDDAPPADAVAAFAESLLDYDAVNGVEAAENRPLVAEMHPVGWNDGG